jgi:hypothetical protein
VAWELLPSPTRPPRAQAPATTTPSLRCAGIFGPHPAGPRSGVQNHQLGFIGSAPVRPACSNNTLQSGFYAPSQGTARQSGSSIPHRVGLQYSRYLTAAPGSTVLNRPAPLGSLSYKLGFIGATRGPACLLQVTTSVRVLRPAPGDGPLGQVHRPRTGSAC